MLLKNAIEMKVMMMKRSLFFSAMAALTLTACATASAPVEQRVDVTPDKLELSETDAIVGVVNLSADKFHSGSNLPNVHTSVQEIWVCRDTSCEFKEKLGEFRDGQEPWAYYAVDTEKYVRIISERRVFTNRAVTAEWSGRNENTNARCQASAPISLKPKGRYVVRLVRPPKNYGTRFKQDCELKVESAETLMASSQ